MGQISWVKTVTQLLKGADRLVLVGPRNSLKKASEAFPDKVSGHLRALSMALNKAMPAGSTLTGRARPTWVSVAALPDEASRHNHPARPDMLPRLIGPALESGHGKVALAIVCEPDHRLPLLNAVHRSVPLYYGDKQPDLQIAFLDPGLQPAEPDGELTRIAESARLMASWVDTPPTEMNPTRFAELAKAQLKDAAGVKVTEIVGDRLLAKGMGGIHGVGRAAVEAPRMLVATCGPRRAARHVALVGKGVTFDTGGLHLKQRGSMEGMKSDMGGAAAVFGAFRALAETDLTCRLTVVVCLAENAVGPKSFKPDDILTLHSGKTVEINNTDAEGRLLLADGVSHAARDLGAQIVIDAATLTGAQLVSTGMLHAAIVSNDDDLERTMVAAGRKSGDLVHPLLFAPELFQQEFKSPVADMRNSVKNRMNAQSSCAAQFVYSHLEGTDVKWGHVDLAGPSFRGERGTGFGVALLAETVKALDSAAAESESAT